MNADYDKKERAKIVHTKHYTKDTKIIFKKGAWINMIW